MRQLTPLNPDEKRFYRHFAECFTCQDRSGQDGRLCSVGNELARQRTRGPLADARDQDDRDRE
jgi:hypothetical protein